MGFEFLKLVCKLFSPPEESRHETEEHGSLPRKGSVLPVFFCYCSLTKINSILFEKKRDLHSDPSQ